MRFSLATLTRRIRNPRRKAIPLREIAPPAVIASDLFRACYAPIIAAITARIDRIIAAYARALAVMAHDGYSSVEACGVPESGLRVSCVKTSGARSQDDTPGAVGPNPTAARLTDSPADLTAELDDMGAELDRLVLMLDPRLRDWATRVEKWQRGKWRGAVLSATGIDLETLLSAGDVNATVRASIEWNAALVKDVSDQARNRIAAAVFAGLQRRRPARDVASDIREAVAMTRRRSLNVASDQLSKLSARLDQARQEQAGITEFIWRHSGKRHPRLYHLARNGKKYPWEGNGLNGDMPGVAPFCGCRAQATISFE